MNIPETYDYLVRARRDLWATLASVPDEVLSRPLLGGAKLHCIKDLVFHVASVEDFWLREEILRDQPLWQTIPALKVTRGGPVYASFALETLLDYWSGRRAQHPHVPSHADGGRVETDCERARQARKAVHRGWSTVEPDNSRGATRGAD